MKKLCIYHGNCADGFGAAMVVRAAFGQGEVFFHEGVYQEPPPSVDGLDVILVDFSYKRDVLLEMAEKANSILILDHHKSAREELVDLPDNVTAFFDMERSGVMMAWDYYFPDDEPPELFKYIQDRDLWKKELEYNREIMAAVFSMPYSFSAWDELLKMDLGDLVREGAAIERKQSKDIQSLIETSASRMLIAGYDVPALNAPYFLASDAGHILGAGEPFAACYWDTPKYRQFSLRSADDGLDVCEIAKRFGGGGHENAAGFRVEHERLGPLGLTLCCFM